MTPLIKAVDAGWPVRVTATGGHYFDKAMENHDQVNLTVQFEREHTMIVAGSTCNATGLEDMIRGTKGNLYLGGNNCVLRPEQAYADDIDPEEHKFAGHRVAPALDTADKLGELVVGRLGNLQKVFARLGRRIAARVTLEKLHAKPFFQ